MNYVSTKSFAIQSNVSEQILTHFLEAAVMLIAQHKLFTPFSVISDIQQATKLTARTPDA